ncbi:hypothetical protein E2562_032886 [Oryza meyeriana var. granulata]|uniref:Uncharacterized protein n=1 Tax=Oryza meyeriana var. granulata TaxID=110450 RepID=A0A6G1F0N8_9ORYZ|nr:hypothetical protein E2562_032886 [Oryza meyeriana var. granulata]
MVPIQGIEVEGCFGAKGGGDERVDEIGSYLAGELRLPCHKFAAESEFASLGDLYLQRRPFPKLAVRNRAP